MSRKIKLNTEGRQSLEKTFGVTKAFVCQALSFKRNSLRAKRVREAALKAGGILVEVEQTVVSTGETIKILDNHGNVTNEIVHTLPV